MVACRLVEGFFLKIHRNAAAQERRDSGISLKPDIGLD